MFKHQAMATDNSQSSNLARIRVKRMQIILSHALESSQFIGTSIDVIALDVQEQLQTQMKQLLVQVQGYMQEVDNQLLAQDKTGNFFLSDAINNTWIEYETNTQKAMAVFSQENEACLRELPVSQQMLLQSILDDITQCFQSNEEPNEVELRDTLWNSLLEVSLTRIGQESNQNPSCFICYSWSDLGQMKRIHQLACKLKYAGIDVKLDVWNQAAIPSSVFISQIQTVDYVLVVGTPGLSREWQNYVTCAEEFKNDSLKGSVVQQLEQVSIRKTNRSANDHYILCILLSGKHTESFPDFLQGLTPIDFGSQAHLATSLFDLLKELSHHDEEQTQIIDEQRQILEQQYKQLQSYPSEKLLALYAVICQKPGATKEDDIESTLRNWIPMVASPLSSEALEFLIQRIWAAMFPLSSDDDRSREVALYVPIQGAANRHYAQTFAVEEEVEAFLAPDEKRRILLLLGYSGSGKTMFCEYLIMKKAKLYTPQTSVIPIYISLPNLINPTDHLIENSLKRYGFTDSQINLLKRTRTFLFILDSYDEVSAFQDKLINLFLDSDTVKNQLTSWNAKFVISCRTSYLVNVDEDYLSYFVPYQNEKPQFERLREINIAPFTKREIENYIENYLWVERASLQERVIAGNLDLKWLKAQAYKDYISQIPGLTQLIETPFLLKITMMILPTIATRYLQEINQKERLRVTGMDLYEEFIKQWFIRQKYKFIVKGGKNPGYDVVDDYAAYSEELAQNMEAHHLQQVTYKDSSELRKLTVEQKQWGRFFSTQLRFFKNEQERELYRRGYAGSPIRKMGNSYSFIHPIIQEYFVSQQMLTEILKLEHSTQGKDQELQNYQFQQ
jgi:NACHT domain/SEFIR domain